jgi:glycosyltransferase involved in cell wall biosynthesis
MNAKNKPEAAIFRLQLFKPSETFIPAQVNHLTTYRPIYVGRKLFGDPGRAQYIVPTAGNCVARNVDQFKLQVFRNPYPLLSKIKAAGLNPAIVHAHFGIDGVYASELSRALDVPLITTLHGFDVTRSDLDMLRSGRPALVNGVLMRNRLLNQCGRFLCVSEFIRKAAIARGYPEDKLQVHYIGIDLERLTPLQGERDPGLVLHVGRLVEKKGTQLLLRAFAQIAHKHEHAKLIIIGDGPLRKHLEAEAARLQISNRVRFLGLLPHDEVLKWDARAAIKAVPSVTAKDGDREGLPTVVMETAALGIPIVAFDSGGIGEAVDHGQTGLLCREFDVDSLAQNLALLLSQSDLNKAMGARARKMAEDRFDAEKQARLLEEHYDNVIEEYRCNKTSRF